MGKMDSRAIDSVEAIIHLAGAGVGDKTWTAPRKEEILGSRVKSIRLLFEELRKEKHQVKTFVSASAIGYYGPGDENTVFHETSEPGLDFLAQVTKRWEEESEKMNSLGIRVVKLRIGIVLSEKGGALKAMAKPIRLGLGSPLGSGQQYLSWIHLDDLCGLFIKAVEDPQLQGVYNAVGTKPVTNVEMTKAIAKVLKKPLWLPPIPVFLLKAVLGERAMLVTTGSKISGEKIQKAGFKLRFTELESALRDLFKAY
jgi:uncharacterized protein (TIGR01777 family)